MRRLAAGDGDLAGLAAELGFADQVHLTRTLRAETGTTPPRCAPCSPTHRPSDPPWRTTTVSHLNEHHGHPP
jgi:AraC-like DNA-binding protein